MESDLDIWRNKRKLFYAVRNGSTKDVEELLDQTKPNLMDSYGQSLVHEAARGNHSKILEILKTAGADLDSVNDQGMTPLMVAACSNNLEAVKNLIEHGANPFHKDKIGRTASYLASVRSPILVPHDERSKWVEIIEF